MVLLSHKISWALRSKKDKSAGWWQNRGRQQWVLQRHHDEDVRWSVIVNPSCTQGSVPLLGASGGDGLDDILRWAVEATGS